jgi:hypothetical protein
MAAWILESDDFLSFPALLVTFGIPLVFLGWLISQTWRRRPDMEALAEKYGIEFLDQELPTEFPFEDLFRFDLSVVTFRNGIFGTREGQGWIAFDLTTGYGQGRALITVVARTSELPAARSEFPKDIQLRSGQGWKCATLRGHNWRTSKLSTKRIEELWKLLS